MAKRIKYKLGDIVLVELENKMFGVGRIIKVDEKVVAFMEFFKMKPISDKSELKFEELTKENIIMYFWCHDSAIRKGKWEIIGNIPVEDNYEMPLFVRPGYTDENRKIWKLVKLDNKCMSYENTGLETTEAEYENYPLCGVGNEVSVPRMYFIKLKKLNLV